MVGQYEMIKPNKKSKLMKINLREQVVTKLDIPTEVINNIPIIKMNGNREITIENFIGLVEYTPHKVRLNTRCGLLIIDGVGLEAKHMTIEKIFIKGSILQVAFAL